MERKRSQATFSGSSCLNKRRKTFNEHDGLGGTECSFQDFKINADLPNDTLASILYLKSIFPQKIFDGLVPPIILKHQIYCIVKDKTLVDRQLNKLWNERKVQLFKLITGSDEFALVLTEDFVSHVRKKITPENSNLLDDFLVNVLPECVDVSISKQSLVEKHQYTENKITYSCKWYDFIWVLDIYLPNFRILVNNGLLQCRDIESWWLGIPGAGVFMKHLTKGRQTILRKIKRRKFKEILLHDLEKCKIPSKLGIMYHIYDIIGAELVKRCETTSGELLRLAT